MNEITLRIRYKAQSNPIKVSIQFEENRVTCEFLAQKLAEKLTSNYAKYLSGKKSIHELKRYEFGQYKLVLHILEKQFL